MSGIAPPAMGYGDAFGIAKESTYGTAISGATEWFHTRSNDIRRMNDLLEMEGGSGQIVPNRYHATKGRGYRGIPDISGNVVVDADFDDIGLLLGATLGASSRTPDGGGGSGAHLNEFSLARLKPAATPKGFTFWRDQDSADPLSLRGAGGVIQNFELFSSSEDADKPVGISLDVVGQSGFDSDFNDSFDLTELSAAPWIEFTDAMVAYHATAGTARGELANQTGGTAFNSYRWRVENNYRIAAATGGATRNIRQPVYNGLRRSTLTLSRDLFDAQFFDQYYASTDAGMWCAIALKLTSTEFITGSLPYYLDVYFPYAYLIRQHPSYGGGNEIVPEELTFVASSNGTAAAVEVDLVNAASAAYWS